MAGRPRKNAEATAAAEEPKAKKATTKKATTSKKSAKTEKFHLSLTKDQAQNASTVSVAGDFNEWSTTANPMSKMLDGGFEIELSLEKGKSYQFRYVLDGATWINDPYRATVDNGMGEQNSVLDAVL
ncbi:MAG: isoamylase early set domain-containing protein [Bacteroidales bacterium]|nr:isoamylase early set domain-containing protein [Bacteroidales bacterium]